MLNCPSTRHEGTWRGRGTVQFLLNLQQSCVQQAPAAVPPPPRNSRRFLSKRWLGGPQQQDGTFWIRERPVATARDRTTVPWLSDA